MNWSELESDELSTSTGGKSLQNVKAPAEEETRKRKKRGKQLAPFSSSRTRTRTRSSSPLDSEKMRQFVAAVLLSLAASSSAASAPAVSTLRVALYVGDGTAPTSASNYSASLRALAASGGIASVTLLQGADVAALSNSAFDVVVFPGGGGSGEAAAIGPAGANAVRAFVSAGGGYLGTCAGGYLAGTSSCCDHAMPGFCGGQVGCSRSPYAMGLVDMGVAEPWSRGHGYVVMRFTDAAVAMLQLDAAKYGRGTNVSILYYQGPVQDRSYTQANFTADALFVTEIHSLHTKDTLVSRGGWARAIATCG